MLENYYSSKILEQLPFEASSQQKELIEQLGVFMSGHSSQTVFLLRGYAGTGKTSVVSAMVRALTELEIPMILMAPTGRAANVLTAYSGRQAQTIHRTIYRQSSPELSAPFTLGYNKVRNALFVVDEVSMLSSEGGDRTFGSGRLLDDLMRYVYEGAPGSKLLLLGDTAQLPPVGQEDSPALQRKTLESFGLTVSEFTLTQVVRQESQSGILQDATAVRQALYTPQNLLLQTFPDAQRVDGSNFLSCLEESYQTVGMEETLIITRSNKKAAMYANGIRSRVLYREDYIENGDLLMVVKNNYLFGLDYGIELIANGNMAEVMRMRGSKTLYGKHFFQATLRLIEDNTEVDAWILQESLSCVNPSELQQLQKELFLAVEEDYADIKNKRERYKKMRQDIYLNALQVKMAYAVTCHKAQGGQWKHVYIDKGFFDKSAIDVSFMRWLYTAITRATEKVYFVQFSDDFFQK